MEGTTKRKVVPSDLLATKGKCFYKDHERGRKRRYPKGEMRIQKGEKSVREFPEGH